MFATSRLADVSLRIEAAGLPPRISVDPAKIAWAVTALVGSALRYVRRGSFTMPGGHVGVSLQMVHDVVAAHGGGMVIKSSIAPEDRGTVVTLWIPVRG